jgi:hypothetical protein
MIFYEYQGFTVLHMGASLYVVIGPYFQGFMGTASEAQRIIAGLIAGQCTV